MNDELTIKQAAQLSGYSRQQLYSLVWDGKIGARKLGFQIFISRKSLLAYCAAHKRTTTAAK